MKDKLKRIPEIATLLAILGWITWSIVESTLREYERLQQTYPSSEASWILVQQRLTALLVVGGILLVGGWLMGWFRRRVYKPQPSDEVLARSDLPDSPALVLRNDQLFLFRGTRPDLLRRSAIRDCDIQTTDAGIVLRVCDATGNTWNYHWVLEEGQVDIEMLRQWVTDWLEEEHRAHQQ